MNSTKHMNDLHMFQAKTQALITKQAILRQQKERKRLRASKQRKRIAVILLVSLFIIVIYAFNLLFNDNTHSHAMEAPATFTEREQVEKVEVKQIVQPKEEKQVIVKDTVAPVVKEQPKAPAPAPQPASIYNANIPMPKEHQEYLYKLCKERGLDFKKTLAVIKHESVFDSNATNATNDYGYFQVNLVNHKALSNKLGTENSPLNPYINMNWGTYMLADLYQHWSKQGYSGQGLDEAVWSSYNKGLTGFKKYGQATEYIYKMNDAIAYIENAY
jgi:hypothetical protein